MYVCMYRCHMNGDIANIKHVDKENRWKSIFSRLILIPMCSNEGILHKCHIRKKSQCETQPYSRTIPLGKHVILENLIGKDRKKKIFK